MSIKTMNLVWSSTLGEPSKRFVLLALADSADDQGKVLRLRVPTLCRKTGISRSTMFELLRKLEHDDKLIQRDERTTDTGSRLSSRFWINLPLLRAMQISDDDLDQEAGTAANPFVSAAQTTNQVLQESYPQPVRDSDPPPSEIRTPPVRDSDPQPVRDSDGARPRAGHHVPYPCSEEEIYVPNASARSDGRTEASPPPTENHVRAAWLLIERFDLGSVDARPRQKALIRNVVATAFAAGYPAAKIEAYLRTKLVEARTVAYVLGAFSPDRLPDIADAIPLNEPLLSPACDTCAAESPAAHRNPRLRVRCDPETGVPTLCRCHPDHIESPSTTPQGALA